MTPDVFIFHDNDSSDGERVRGITISTAHVEYAHAANIEISSGGTLYYDTSGQHAPSFGEFYVLIEIEQDNAPVPPEDLIWTIDMLPGFSSPPTDTTPTFLDYLF